MALVIYITITLFLIVLPILAVFLIFRSKKKYAEFKHEQNKRWLEWEMEFMKSMPDVSPSYLPETRRVMKQTEIYQRFILPINEKIAELTEKVEIGLHKGRIYLHGSEFRWDKTGHFESEQGTTHSFKYRNGKPIGDEVIQALEPILVELLELMNEREGKMLEFSRESKEIKSGGC